MVNTPWMYPQSVVNQNIKVPHWSSAHTIINQAQWEGAAEGGSVTGHNRAYASIVAGTYTDRIIGKNYGFTIPLNARIDGIQARILRSGMYTKDKIVTLTVNGSNLNNYYKYRQRTDMNLIVDTYGSLTDKWGSKTLTPAKLNDPEFQLKLEVYNNSSSSKMAYVYVMGLGVAYTNPTYSITTDLPQKLLINKSFQYDITLTSTNKIGNGIPIPVQLAFPSNITITNVNYDGAGEYDPITHIWNAKLGSNYQATITVTATANTTGSQNQVITETEYNTVLTSPCEVLATDSNNIVSCIADITDTTTLNNLTDGEIYTISAYNKVVDAGVSGGGIWGGIRNNRIAVVNGDEITGGRPTAQNTYQRVGVSFQYDSAQPLTIKMYGQYQEVSTQGVEEWAGFTIKKGHDKTYTPRINLLSDPDALMEDASYTTLTLPSAGETPEYIYTFDPTPPLDGVMPFIRSVTLTLDVQDRTSTGIEVQLVNSQGVESSVKSKNFTDESSQIILGSDTDLWGLTSDDIYGETLTAKIKFLNTSLSEITPDYKNLILTLGWQDDETYGSYGCTVNGVHSRNYNLQIYDVDIPEGPSRDINTLNLPRGDGELVTSQSLKSLELSIKFRVWGDTIEEAKEKLGLISVWLNNTRDNMGRPIPNTIVFDFDILRNYRYILTDPISVTQKFTSMECEASMTVPIGVALNAEPTITGSVGENNGIIKVPPVITVLADGSSSIVLTDAISGHEVEINHAFTSGDVVTVDCENRTVTDQNNVDYSTSVNINSIWFNFYKKYDISCTGGLITEVSYTEGN